MTHIRYGIYYKTKLQITYLTLSKAQAEAFLLIKNRGWEAQAVEIKQAPINIPVKVA